MPTVPAKLSSIISQCDPEALDGYACELAATGEIADFDYFSKTDPNADVEALRAAADRKRAVSHPERRLRLTDAERNAVEIDVDVMVHGAAFVDERGRRIDPAKVVPVYGDEAAG